MECLNGKHTNLTQYRGTQSGREGRIPEKTEGINSKHKGFLCKEGKMEQIWNGVITEIIMTLIIRMVKYRNWLGSVIVAAP